MIRIAIGDGSYLVREGIQRVAAADPQVEIVAACEDLATLRAAITRERPQVVVTDLRLPPTGTDEGLRLAAELRRTHPGVGVVILSEHAEPAAALEFLREGSDGRAYLLKDGIRQPRDLARAVRAVAVGDSVTDPRVVERLLEPDRSDQGLELAPLTPRELEILALVSDGLNNEAIAVRLAITKRAVERHIHSIFAKLGIGDAEHVSRRVKATLMFRSARAVGRPPCAC